MKAVIHLIAVLSLSGCAIHKPVDSYESTRNAVIAQRKILEPQLESIDREITEQIILLRAKLKSLDPRIGEGAEQRLVDSHVKWKFFLSDYCAAGVAPNWGGSPWFGVEESKCKIRVSKQRLAELKLMNRQASGKPRAHGDR
jgi:hypothetical protein